MPNWDSNSPKDFGWNPAFTGWVPFVYLGRSFPQGVHPAVHDLFVEALDKLLDYGLELPPPSLGLQAGCWGAEQRNIGGTTSRSFHAYGLALDIAAPWNPQGTDDPPLSGYRLWDNTGDLLEPLGILWGGSPRFAPQWDRMHIECHLSPTELAHGGTYGAPASAGTPYPLLKGDYYGPYSGPASSISGSGLHDAAWRPGLARAQQRLGVPADGYYGPITAAAARKWQTDHHLVVDGLIGPATWRSMFP